MQASNGEQDSITGINVTPMVDVMIVLLIIFMATAPLLSRRALHVNVPKAAKSERLATETVRVEMNAKREVLLDGRRYGLADLGRELERMVALQPATHVAIAADEVIPYGEVVGLIDVIKGAGIKRIGLEVRHK